MKPADEIDLLETVGTAADDLKAVAERMPAGECRDEVKRVAEVLNNAAMDTVVFVVSTEDS